MVLVFPFTVKKTPLTGADGNSDELHGPVKPVGQREACWPTDVLSNVVWTKSNNIFMRC